MKHEFSESNQYEKLNTEVKNKIDFDNKDEITYWAYKLKISKRQLQAARQKTGSVMVEDIQGYLNKKFTI